MQTTEAAMMIRSLFVSLQELNKGARRPANVPPTKVKKLAVIGAGFMGASVGYVSARAGIDVVLVDRIGDPLQRIHRAVLRIVRVEIGPAYRPRRPCIHVPPFDGMHQSLPCNNAFRAQYFLRRGLWRRPAFNR